MASQLLFDDKLEEAAESFRIAKVLAAEDPVKLRASGRGGNRAVLQASRINGGSARSLFRPALPAPFVQTGASRTIPRPRPVVSSTCQAPMW